MTFIDACVSPTIREGQLMDGTLPAKKKAGRSPPLNASNKHFE
jgi:hypothetical protein